jgi:hypothetical protein
MFGHVPYIIKALGGGACVDTLSVTDTGSSPKSLLFYYIWINVPMFKIWVKVYFNNPLFTLLN